MTFATASAVIGNKVRHWTIILKYGPKKRFAQVSHKDHGRLRYIKACMESKKQRH